MKRLGIMAGIVDGKAYYLKGMTAKVLASSDGQAVLSLTWSSS